MSQKRGESAADMEIAVHLAEFGFDTTPRQIRTWRTSGLLPKARRRPQGYARTVIGENVPGTFERATALARATEGKRKSIDDLVLKLFFNGEEVPLPLLHGAFAHHLTALHCYLETNVGGTEDPVEIQEKILALLRGKKPRTKLGRFLYSNLELLSCTPKSMKINEQHVYMSSVFAVMVSLLLGLDARVLTGDNLEHRDALDELIDVARLNNLSVPATEGVSTSEEGHRHAVREYIFQLYEGASLMELAEAVHNYSLEDLRRLSDVIRQTLEVGQLKARNDRILSTGREPLGLPAGEKINPDLTLYAFGALLLGFWINDLKLVDREQAARALAAAQLHQQDLDQLIRGLGPRYYRILSSDGQFENFPKASVTRFRKALNRFEGEHPDIVRRLRDQEYEV